MLIKLYADNPDYRLLSQLIDQLRDGAVFIYPTASGYAYCCDALNARAIEYILWNKGNYVTTKPITNA